MAVKKPDLVAYGKNKSVKSTGAESQSTATGTVKKPDLVAYGKNKVVSQKKNQQTAAKTTTSAQTAKKQPVDLWQTRTITDRETQPSAKQRLNSVNERMKNATINGDTDTLLSLRPEQKKLESQVYKKGAKKEYTAEQKTALKNLKKRQTESISLGKTEDVAKLQRQMMDIRAENNRQTLGDRALNTTASILEGSLGQTTNAVGTGADVARSVVNGVHSADYNRRQIAYIQKALADGKTSDGSVLTDAQRKAMQQRIQTMQDEIDRWENPDSTVYKAHHALDKPVSALYQAADEMVSDSAKQQEHAKKNLGAVGSTLVDAVTSTGQSAFSGVAGAVTGTGMLPFVVQAFGGSAQEARNAGADLTHQVGYGTMEAAKEYVTEKMFGLTLPQKMMGSAGAGSFDSLIEKGIRNVTDRLASTPGGQKVLGGLISWLASGATEGAEEIVGDAIENTLINPTLRKWDPDTRTTQEKFEDALYDGLVGGLSGMIGGVNQLVGYQPSGNAYNVQNGVQGENNVNETMPGTTEEISAAAPGETMTQGQQTQVDAIMAALERQRQETTAAETQQNAVPAAVSQQEERTVPTEREAVREPVVRAADTESGADASAALAQRQFARLGQSLGDNGKKALRFAYDGVSDTGEYSLEFLQAYHSGMTGQENPNPGSAVSFAAYNAGQNDAAASLEAEKAAVQSAQTAGEESGLQGSDYEYLAGTSGSAVADEVDAVSRALGVRVRMEEQVLNGQANGNITGSEVLIAEDAEDPALQVVGHEWTHRVQELAPEEYRAYRDAVTSIPEVQEAAEILLDRYNRAGVEISYEKALDEATANYSGKMIRDGNVLDDFIRKHGSDRTMLQKLRDAIHEIVGKLTGRARKQAQTVEGKLQAAFEAAAKQAGSLQAENGNDTMGATRYSAKGKYWRPDLTQNEWTLLNRHMEQEISDSAHTLDESTQWAYAEEKGNRVFAIYGIGDGTEATPLYASGGKTAMADYQAFSGYGKEFDYGADRSTETFSRLFKALRRKQGQGNGSVLASERGKSANGHDRVSAVQGEGNGRGSAGTGTENRGVNTKFSLKTPVEETDKLIAVHNKDEDSILSALKLGGLPMPSIAVVKAKSGHSKYGPISLLFNKSTIDPQADSRNKVYGGDAYTPTNPGVEYPVNATAARKAENAIYDLSKNVADGIFANSSVLGRHGIEDVSRNSLLKTAENLANDDTVRAAYLAAQGKTLEPVYQEKVWDSKVGNDTLKTIVDKIGVQQLAEINANFELGESSETALGESADLLRNIMREHYRELGEPLLQKMAKKRGWSPEEISEKRNARIERSMENVTPFTLENLARHAWEMYQDGGATAGEIDRMGTREKLRELTDGADVKDWVEKQLDGVLGEPGINNGKDPYTSAGNRRSFDETHYSYTLENIVRAMQETQEERGGQVSGVTAGGLQASSVPSYRTIQEIRDDSGRLGSVETDSYKAQMEGVEAKIQSVTQRIMQTTEAHSDNSFDEEGEIIGDVLMDAAKGKRTIDSIMRTFAKEDYKISNVTAKQIQELYRAAAALPTEYFEAKPQRAVGFDEVLAAVIPDNSSDRLKNALRDAGVNMVEYTAGDEADRLAKVNNVDDAQFSLKGADAQELAALKRENDRLKERVEYWRGQTKRSKGVTTDKKSVSKAADALVKDYGAEISGSDIAGDLQSLYDYIASGKDGKDELTYTEARRRSDAIAEKIAESAVAVDDQMYQEYAGLRKFLKTQKITLSAQDAANITDYGDWRKSLFGKMNVSKGEHSNIDQVYSELSEQYPEFFDPQRDSSTDDQLQRMAEVANQLYEITEYNPFDGYMGQAVASISNDIMDRFFDLPQTKKTFADRQAEQVQNARSAGKQAAKDAFLAGQMAQGRQDARRLRSATDALAKERTRRAEQVQKLKDRYRAKDAARRDTQSRKELRAKIIRHANTLSQKLLRPTDKQHIPEELRSSVAAVLNSINQESKYTLDENGKHVYDGSGTPTGRTVAFQNLKEQYQRIAEESGMVVDPSLFGEKINGQEARGAFDEVISMGDTRLADLSREQLQTMWNVLKSVEHSVQTAGKTLASEKFETTRAFADAFRTGTMTRKHRKGGSSISLETPYTFFSRYGKAGEAVYRMLRDAQDRQELMSRDVEEMVHRILSDKPKGTGVVGKLEEWRGNTVWKMNTDTREFTTSEGKKLTLTPAQAMEIYLLSKRPQAQTHLMKGGIVQPEIENALTGKTKIERGTEFIRLSLEDLKAISGSLTADEARIADELQKLTTGVLADYGNEASMKAYGYKKFTEENYWPIHSAGEALHSNVEKNSDNQRSIKNIGMAQAVQPNATTALDISGVFDTFSQHASDMIDYAAWLCPMEDANRLFNFQFRTESGETTGKTLKGLLEDKGGKGAQQYWKKLMADIQNGIGNRGFEPWTGKFAKGVGRFKGAAVGANIRVIIQQPTAFFRASVVLDAKDMARGLTGGVTKGSGWQKALKYSPIAMRKDVGSFDISSPYTLNDRFYGKTGNTTKINDAAGKGAGAADAITWGALWNACEWQVKRESPNLRAGSSEFYSAVNRVFTNMIDQTQVVDGILQRSNIMRSEKDLAQQATAFMGEPIMSLNVMMRAYDSFKYEQNPQKRGKALKKVGRAATALVTTNVVNALAQSIIDGIRDDDRDKDYWERVLSAFTGIAGNEENWAQYLTNVLFGNVGSNMNPIANVPFAKDVLSIWQGYDVSRPDMETFSDLVDATKTAIDSAGGTGKKTRKEALLGLFAAAGKMMGLPAYNVKRDTMAMVRTIAVQSGNIPFQYEVEKFTYNIGNAGNKSRFMSLLYAALEQGDYTSFNHMREDLMENMPEVTGKSIDSSMANLYKNKKEKDPDYKLPQKSMDYIGTHDVFDTEEKEDAFDSGDLDAKSYDRYASQRQDTYRKAEDAINNSNAFRNADNETKNKALNNAKDFAEKTALAENSGGKYQISENSWILKAQEAQKKYGIDPGTYSMIRAQISGLESWKDKNGDTIQNSKGYQIMQVVNDSGLTEKQKNAMYEYLGVPKGIRHMNKAAVKEQLERMKKRAAK